MDVTPEQAPHDGDLSDPMTGRLLDGRYRILHQVARGGMASIHTAQDTRLDRVVAVKLMHPALAGDAAFTDRFVREARAAARLSHPNVVAVYDQGTDADTLYLVMEYVEGHTLRDVIREQAPMAPLAALTLLKPILQALAAAHAAPVVHRDVKPENVLIATDGRVKVADFGLAKAVSADTQHTATGGVLIGTVSYLAPELVVEGRIDPRVDVYAAGVLLYEMLTGVKPHDGETPIQIAWAHVHTDVPAPSRRVPGLPDYVDALVARATARDRTLRPADASVLLRHVNRVGQALAEGVASDPELTADLVPLTLNPSTGQMVTTDTAPDPFDEAELASIREPREVPDLPPAGPEATRVFPAGPPAEPTRAVHTDVPLPTHGPDHTTVVPRDDIPLAADPGALTDSRRSRRAQAKAARTTPARPRPTRRRGILVLLLALLLAIGVGTGAWWFGWARYTDTPGALGMTAAEARTAVTDAGLDVDLADPVFSETVPKDHVVRTEPATGERVLRDGSVTLFLSKGPERYAVPELAGLDQVAAEDLLRENNLEIGEISQAWSETVGTDLVIGTDPVLGTELRRGDKVTVVLSKGKRPWPVKDFTGKDADDARKKLDKRFELLVTEEHSDTVEKGKVISQTPSSGTLFTDDQVSLVISKGPVMVEVPGVLRDSEEDAIEELEDAGFTVKVDRSRSLGLDLVYSQDPRGGKAPKGSTVTIRVA